MRNILYFGYGANRDSRMMAAITGNKKLVGRPGILKSFKLVVKRLDQAPDVVLPGAPLPFSPLKILEGKWPKHFKSYSIIPCPGSDVYGTIWELTNKEYLLVADWELLEFGWYKQVEAYAVDQNGQEVQVITEALGDGLEYESETEGKSYYTWLNPPEEFEKIAAIAREEYFARKE